MSGLEKKNYLSFPSLISDQHLTLKVGFVEGERKRERKNGRKGSTTWPTFFSFQTNERKINLHAVCTHSHNYSNTHAHTHSHTHLSTACTPKHKPSNTHKHHRLLLLSLSPSLTQHPQTNSPSLPTFLQSQSSVNRLTDTHFHSKNSLSLSLSLI